MVDLLNHSTSKYTTFGELQFFFLVANWVWNERLNLNFSDATFFKTAKKKLLPCTRFSYLNIYSSCIHLFIQGSWIYRWGYNGRGDSELCFTYSTRGLSILTNIEQKGLKIIWLNYYDTQIDNAEVQFSHNLGIFPFMKIVWPRLEWKT